LWQNIKDPEQYPKDKSIEIDTPKPPLHHQKKKKEKENDERVGILVFYL
jgi:hypothetical protein